MPVGVCVFDAYGTLFDVAAAARLAAAEPGGGDLARHRPKLAEDWRAKQLSYTWLRSVAGEQVDFWQVTGDALDWAMAASGLDDAALRARLMAHYRDLPAYPEAAAVLRRLKASGTATAILSNGTPEMLEAAIASAGIGGDLDAVLSIEALGVFKPHASVYGLVCERFGCARAEVLFVSANGWDAAAASGYGFRAVWVNRRGEPVDRLWAEPAHVVADLSAVPEIAAA